jgi:amino-acid N-acetyltransferase
VETSIEPARVEDIADVERLLEENRLPVEGWRELLSTAIVARGDGRVIGSAALEPYADGVLLRSVAVAPELHHHGVGQKLTHAVIRLAEELGAPAIYLLTTTAEGFFPRFGFEPIPREDVPATVQASIEFTSACPASATVMRKRLSRSAARCARRPKVGGKIWLRFAQDLDNRGSVGGAKARVMFAALFTRQHLP